MSPLSREAIRRWLEGMHDYARAEDQPYLLAAAEMLGAESESRPAEERLRARIKQLEDALRRAGAAIPAELSDEEYAGAPLRPDHNPQLAPFCTLNSHAQAAEWERYEEDMTEWRARPRP